jgi:hypothetical protein
MIKRLLGYIPMFQGDLSKHRKYTSMYEDLCQ